MNERTPRASATFESFGFKACAYKNAALTSSKSNLSACIFGNVEKSGWYLSQLCKWFIASFCSSSFVHEIPRHNSESKSNGSISYAFLKAMMAKSS